MLYYWFVTGAGLRGPGSIIIMVSFYAVSEVKVGKPLLDHVIDVKYGKFYNRRLS